jgi:nicotinamide-nucleotide amidase
MKHTTRITATILTIGDELLIGQVVDTNSAWIGKALGTLGIQVVRRTAIGDDATAIKEALDAELPRVNLLIVTGGLGPTADDITKPTLASYFGGGMRTDARVLEHVETYFRKRGKPTLQRNLQQADVPEACTVLFNEKGTAPGMWFEKADTIVVSLPGVPHEMVYLMEAEVLPRLRKRFVLQPVQHRNILIGGEGESFIAEQIQDLEESLPEYIRLAYLPSLGSLRLRLTCQDGNRTEIGAEMDDWCNRISDRLQEYVVAQSDLPMQEILSQILDENKWKLALAESCTGGCIAHLQTQIAGASNYLQGSIVCYQPDVKVNLVQVSQQTIDTKGIVSEAVALEMAHGAAKVLKGDIGFGITGWLGKEGDDKAPGGTVCMAVTLGEQSERKTFHFANDRIRNKELAVQNAFLFIIRFLKKQLTDSIPE